ncbi:hypothetical protein [Aliidiomarina quisquiliarum]|uniref:hypothetical protein n=1 Tax=Aliidiomarina quisquiliarum TaxID=2938947 RepID=UPI00208E73A5|nr:hypothetical protein [Aliidiomarina quisquiliarum]MCO4322343.1 hypothetical protein [Aliidiomarina quisquiliarum]
MKAYWLVWALLIILPAQASRTLGVEWFSIIEKKDGEIYLQVSHLFLGAGPREAYFELIGCTDEALWLKVPYDDEGLRIFTETQLEHCVLSEPLRLGLYFEESGEKQLFKVYEEKPVQYLIPESKELFSICSDKSFYVHGSIPSSLQGKDLNVSYRKSDSMVTFEKVRVLFGYYFDIRLHDELDCTQISGGYINDTFFPTYEIPGA